MIGSISRAGQYYGYYAPSGYANAVERRRQMQGAEGTDTAAKIVNAEVPSKQTQRASIVQQGVQNGIPFLREGADPAEMAVRMRMQYNMDGQSESLKLQDAGQPGADIGAAGVQKAFEEGECETCEKRKYKDGSDDPGVSFKSPTRIAPEQAASAVRGHEMEHVVRENAKAQREDRKVVSQSVTIHTAICPECGKPYVSGGTTRTTTAAETQPQADTFQQAERRPFSAVA